MIRVARTQRYDKQKEKTGTTVHRAVNNTHPSLNTITALVRKGLASSSHGGEAQCRTTTPFGHSSTSFF